MADESASVFNPCHCGVLRKASRHLSQIYDAALAPIGIKTTQLSLLFTVDHFGDTPPTMGELAELMVMERSTVSRNLRLLERDGLVAIARGQEDARRRRISVTDKGRGKMTLAVDLWRGVQRRLELAYGEEDTEALRTALMRLVATEVDIASMEPVPVEDEAVAVAVAG